MPDTSRQPVGEQPTLAWTELADRVDAFIDAWQGDDIPPTLGEFLPDEPGSLRLMVLAELIKIDLEYRWQQHELPKLVEEYVEEFPELAGDNLPCAIIYEEFLVRREEENPPAPDDYYRRFPRLAETLKRMLCVESNKMMSTTLMARGHTADVSVGEQLDDFDLLVQLGKGSFGSVFLARQRSMQRLVALKISRDRGAEPQTLAQLDHPNIVRVYDQRVLADRKLQLMYMQHIPGGTLAAVIEHAQQQAPALRCGKTVLAAVDAALEARGDSAPESSARRRLTGASWAEAVCWLGARLAAALEYAHQRGVLHRDVKPANVLLAADGSPKLVDFNVSYASKLEGATPAAYFGGSLAYMSPEQLEANNPDHERLPDELDGRSDVYSLGVVLWELLCGTRPFGEEHMEANWSATLKALTDRRRFGLSPSALAALPPDLPPGLLGVLRSCLAPNVEDRPATAGALARQLELCLQPRVQRLLSPGPTSLRQRLRRWPFWGFVLLGLVPSVIFSSLNLYLNSKLFVPPPEVNAAVHDFFWRTEVPLVNAISFPIAIAVVFGFAFPVLVAVRRLGRGQQVPVAELPRLRRRALYVGDCAGWFGMLLWVISGVVFPGWMHMHLGDAGGIEPSQYRNFLVSAIVCGWISSALTFFLLTFMFVRSFYPMLVRPEQSSPGEVDGLVRLERRAGYCFYLAFSAPFAAMLLLALLGSEEQFVMVVMGLLAAIGFLASLAAFKMLQGIRADLAALAVAIDPTREIAAGSETVESFWSGTR